MKKYMAFAIVLLFAAPPITAQSTSIVVISELFAAPTTGSEWIELTNTGSRPVDLKNWVIEDASANKANLRGILSPHHTLLIYSSLPSEPDTLQFGKTSVWNNDQDVATLKDSSGTVVDVFSYGSAGATMPQMPPPNKSFALTKNGSWTVATPTPNSTDIVSGTSLVFVVPNFVPTAQIHVAGTNTSSVRAGQPVELLYEVQDVNGVVQNWSLSDDAQMIEPTHPNSAGNETGAFSQFVEAPRTGGTWRVFLNVTDGEHSIGTSLAIQIIESGLDLTFPSGKNLHFTPWNGISGNLSSGPALEIVNKDGYEREIFVDMNNLTSTTDAEISVSEHLVIRVSVGNETREIPYSGPLTSIGLISPDEVNVLEFLLVDLTRLPPGTFATTYSVVG